MATALVDESVSGADREAVAAEAAGITVAGAIAAAASLGAGLVHAGAAGSHNGTRTLALLFAAAAVVQIAVAAVAGLRPSRASYGALVTANLVFLGAWAFTRLSGVDFIAGLEEKQEAGLADLTAAAFAALAVVSGLVALRSGARGTVVRPGLGVIIGAVALLAAVPAMAAPHGHGHGAVVAAGAGNVIDGVKLPEVAGVTPEQKVKAAKLISDTRAGVAKFSDVSAATAAGFRSIGDGFTGFEHFVNAAYLVDQNVLDPNEPESLVFKVEPDGTKTLASAMYILPPGKTMADVPDIAGDMTLWHDHQNLCWDATGTRLAGVLVNGQCRPGGTFRPTPPMLHVWVTEHPCGPFAGIEGSAHTGACHPTDHHS